MKNETVLLQRKRTGLSMLLRNTNEFDLLLPSLKWWWWRREFFLLTEKQKERNYTKISRGGRCWASIHPVKIQTRIKYKIMKEFLYSISSTPSLARHHIQENSVCNTTS